MGSILLAAIGTDLKFEKIYNGLIVLGVIGVIAKILVTFELNIFADSCLGFAIPIVSLFVLFYFHMFGAGDIKLLAVAGGFLGVTGSIFCIAVSFSIGAVFAIIKMLYYQNFQERFAYFFHYMKRYLKSNKRTPYYRQNQNKTSRIHFSIPIACSVAVYYVAGGM